MMKLGIALSGGGVPGCAHVGVLRALEEHGIAVQFLSGTSSGALVAALYGCGYNARELADLVPAIMPGCLDYDLGGLVRCLWRRGKDYLGLVKGERIRRFVMDHTGGVRMYELKRPVALMAVDLSRARKVVFSSRPLTQAPPDCLVVTDIPVADAVLASCAVPVLFRPVRYQDMVLVDGGVLDNCPVSLLHELGAERAVAVNLVGAPPIREPIRTCLALLMRSVTVNLAHQVRALKRHADLVLEPDLCSVGMFHFDRAMFCLEEGYACAVRQLDEIRQLCAAEGSKQPARI